MTRSFPRRQMLRVLGLSPLAAIPAQDVHAADSPDAAIIALGSRWEALNVTIRAHGERMTAAEAAADAAMPSKPEALIIRRGDWFCDLAPARGQAFSVSQVNRWREALASPRPGICMSPRLHAEFVTRGREVVGAWDSWVAARQTVSDAFGLKALDARADELGSEAYRLETAILTMKATTPAGWRVKARIVAASLGAPDGTYEDATARNLVADILGDSAADFLEPAPETT